MVSFIKKHIDADVIFTLLHHLWRLLSAPLILIFIPLYLNPQNQGFWFTFISLSALSVFADLGFTNIVLQFSAHEFSHLSFTDKYVLQGDQAYLERLSSLFLFIIKWAGLMIVLVFPTILIIGIVMFSSSSESTDWLLPWILYLVGSAISFFNNSLLSFIEGCDLVSRVQRIRFEIAVINTVLIIVLLYSGGNLYALATGMIVSSSYIFFHLIRTFGKLIKQLYQVAKTSDYSWKKEFFNLLWRYAISFVSGYFLFQIYTPLTFHYYNAIEAGKVGISISLWTALFTISSVWLVSRTPRINMHTAKGDWKSLDRDVLLNGLLSSITFLFGFAFFFGTYLFLKNRIDIINTVLSRFMDLFPLLTLGIAWFFQVIVNTIALYLRPHKKEPLVIPSLVTSIYTAITTFFTVKYFPSDYLFIGFLSSYIIGIPWIIIILFKKRKEWH